jgi:hypothetical protein
VTPRVEAFARATSSLDQALIIGAKEKTMDPSNPLAPIFAASFAVQQILEMLSVFVEKWFGEKRKKAVLGIVGFVIGFGFASYFELYAMKYFGITKSGGAIDLVVTALIMSAGTEGTNSIVKFLKYLKEDKKATAAETVQSVAKRSTQIVASSRSVSPDALRTLEKMRTAAGREAPATALRKTGAATDGDMAAAYSYISEK